MLAYLGRACCKIVSVITVFALVMQSIGTPPVQAEGAHRLALLAFAAVLDQIRRPSCMCVWQWKGTRHGVTGSCSRCKYIDVLWCEVSGGIDALLPAEGHYAVGSRGASVEVFQRLADLASAGQSGVACKWHRHGCRTGRCGHCG